MCSILTVERSQGREAWISKLNECPSLEAKTKGAG